MNQTPPSTHEPEVLLFVTSPYGTLDAIVQHDGKSIYFYINESKPESDQLFGTRACWVRNLKMGPLMINDDEMRQGISPLLPKTHCVHRDAQPFPNPDQLRIVWLEEGNGAALIEETPDSDQSKILAIIPPWSGLEGFHGYADECAVESPLCWPMPDNPRLIQRIHDADRFWKSFQSDVDPFPILQREILTAYDEQFLKPVSKPHSSEPDNINADRTAPARNYYQIDGGQFPPRGLVEYESDHQVILATVGMSLCPQPAVEIFTDNPRTQRRIELAIQITDDASDARSAKIERLRNQLTRLASYPWRNFTWLGAGHTCRFQNLAPNCDSALLVHESQFNAPPRHPIELPSHRDDPINLLWLQPTGQTTK